jgi:hypothetical protein
MNKEQIHIVLAVALVMLAIACPIIACPTTLAQVTPQKCLELRAVESADRAKALYEYLEDELLREYNGDPVDHHMRPRPSALRYRYEPQPFYTVPYPPETEQEKRVPGYYPGVLCSGRRCFVPCGEDYLHAMRLLRADGWEGAVVVDEEAYAVDYTSFSEQHSLWVNKSRHWKRDYGTKSVYEADEPRPPNESDYRLIFRITAHQGGPK